MLQPLIIPWMCCSDTQLSSLCCCPDRRTVRCLGATWGAPPAQGIPALHPLKAPLHLPHPLEGQAGTSRAAWSAGTGSGAVPAPQEGPRLPPPPSPRCGAARADDAILGSPNMAAARAAPAGGAGPGALAGPGGTRGALAPRTGLLRALRAPLACPPQHLSSPGFTRLPRALP